MPVVTKFSDLDLSKEYTYADYMLWQFSERVELIKGYIKKMNPAPNRLHQTISQRLNHKIYSFFEHHPCSVFVAPFDVVLPIPSKKKNTTVVQPDICVVCDSKKLTDQGCNGAPDLIVEILSPKNAKHDLDTKFKLYQEASVAEYWVVETEQRLVLVYSLLNQKYVGSKPFTEGEIIESNVFPELKLAVEDVFYGI